MGLGQIVEIGLRRRTAALGGQGPEKKGPAGVAQKTLQGFAIGRLDADVGMEREAVGFGGALAANEGANGGGDAAGVAGRGFRVGSRNKAHAVTLGSGRDRREQKLQRCSAHR